MQPLPVENERPSVFDAILTDVRLTERLKRRLEHRRQVGIETYGVALQPFNGRDAIQDACEEALDLLVYLMQAIEETPPGTGRGMELSYHYGSVIPVAEFLAFMLDCRPRPQP